MFECSGLETAPTLAMQEPSTRRVSPEFKRMIGITAITTNKLSVSTGRASNLTAFAWLDLYVVDDRANCMLARGIALPGLMSAALLAATTLSPALRALRSQDVWPVRRLHN